MYTCLFSITRYVAKGPRQTVFRSLTDCLQLRRSDKLSAEQALSDASFAPPSKVAHVGKYSSIPYRSAVVYLTGGGRMSRPDIRSNDRANQT